MFTKPTSSSPNLSSGQSRPTPVPPSPAPAPSAASGDSPSPRRGPKVASLVAEDMVIEGGVAGEGELHVDGVVRGDIKIARLTIGESGQVEGSVTAESVECRGRVVGAVTAKQVRLYACAHVDGDITHEQLAMEAGAFFQGRSLKFQRALAPPVAVKTEEGPIPSPGPTALPAKSVA